MGINEQFFSHVARKVAGLASKNIFRKANTFKSSVSVEGALSASGSFATPDAGELTIATGVITVTGANHTVDTESDAASDDLDTINGGVDGMEVTLRAENTARTIVIKNGTGNVKTFDGGDLTLDNTEKQVKLKYDAELAVFLAQSSGVVLLDEDNMVSDSDTQGATQQSIKAYTDSLALSAANVVAFVDTVITAADTIIFGDATDSNALKKDTVQGILDLAVTSTTYGGVGTYLLAEVITTNTAAGATVAGSKLNAAASKASDGVWGMTTDTISGTWRNMGGDTTPISIANQISLWVRTV